MAAITVCPLQSEGSHTDTYVLLKSAWGLIYCHSLPSSPVEGQCRVRRCPSLHHQDPVPPVLSCDLSSQGRQCWLVGHAGLPPAFQRTSDAPCLPQREAPVHWVPPHQSVSATASACRPLRVGWTRLEWQLVLPSSLEEGELNYYIPYNKKNQRWLCKPEESGLAPS